MSKLTEAKDSLNIAKRRMMLFFGPAKSGKTTLACNLLGKDNTVVFAFDPDGVKSVLPIDVFYIDPKRPWEDTLDTLNELQKLKDKKKCIVVSDLTQASKLYYRTSGDFKDPRKTYGIAIDRMMQLMEQLKQNFRWATIIFEAVDMYVEDEQEKITTALPNVIGKTTLAPQIPMMVDDVLYFNLPKQIKQKSADGKSIETVVERTILTAADGFKLAGNRINKAGETAILDLNEEVSIGHNDFSKIEALRKKFFPEGV
jgi:hypothetical protein